MKIIYGSYLENLLSSPPKKHKEISKERKLELDKSYRRGMNPPEMIEKWENSPIKIYDDNGNLLREEKYQDDSLHRIYLAELTENTYDDNGNLIKTSFMETPYKQNGVGTFRAGFEFKKTIEINPEDNSKVATTDTFDGVFLKTYINPEGVITDSKKVNTITGEVSPLKFYEGQKYDFRTSREFNIDIMKRWGTPTLYNNLSLKSSGNSDLDKIINNSSNI